MKVHLVDTTPSLGVLSGFGFAQQPSYIPLRQSLRPVLTFGVAPNTFSSASGPFDTRLQTDIGLGPRSSIPYSLVVRGLLTLLTLRH